MPRGLLSTKRGNVMSWRQCCDVTNSRHAWVVR